MDLDHVFPIQWEIVANRNSAAGSGWEIIAHAFVLLKRFGNSDRLDHGRKGDISYRQTCDLVCCGEISFQQRGRHGENLADIVEAIRRVVRWQQGGKIDSVSV